MSKGLTATLACACLDTSGVASLRHDKHTPRKRKQSNKRKMKAQTEAKFGAEPLAVEGEKTICFRYALLTHSPSDSYGASSLPEGAFGGHSPNDVVTSVANDVAFWQ